MLGVKFWGKMAGFPKKWLFPKELGFMKTIKMRLILVIVGVSVLTTLLIGGFFIYNMIQASNAGLVTYQKELRENVERELQLQTESAISVINSYYQKQQAGLLTKEQAMKEAADRIRDMRYNDGAGYFAIDTYEGINVVLLGRDTEGKSRLDAVDPNGKRFIEEIIANGRKDGGGYTEFMFAKPDTTEPLPKVNYSAAFAPYQWVIETGVWIDYIDAQIAEKAAEQHAELYSGIIRVVIYMLILEALLVVFGVYMGKKIGYPIQLMAQRINTLATGDFRIVSSTEIEALMDRPDEIGQMSRAVRDLRANISKLMKTIMESSEYVASASEELTASSDQSASVSGQVADSIVKVAASCNEQLTAVNDAGGRANDLSLHMSEFRGSLETAHQTINTASQTASDGSQQVGKAVDQMHSIETAVGESTEVIAGLGEQSKKIGTIVDTISAIAAQTNLLALNAAIEAARAGEHGRGFAVVADEVRKLAEQSQDAASRIAELIRGIQTAAGQAVAAMKTGNEQVKSGTDAVTRAGDTFRDIAVMVNKVSDESNKMSQTVQGLAGGTAQISKAVQTIEEMSRKVSGESQTVSAATEEQTSTMNEIANASRSLAEMAQKLQEAAAKFQI